MAALEVYMVFLLNTVDMAVLLDCFKKTYKYLQPHLQVELTVTVSDLLSALASVIHKSRK